MKHEFELHLALMSILTFCLWINDISFIVGIPLFLYLFYYLYKNKYPNSYFILLILYSVMFSTKFSKLDYILIVLLSFILIKDNIKESYFVKGYLFKPLIIYLVYNIASIIWSPDPLYTLWGIATILEGHLAYYIITNSKLKIDKSSFITISKIASFIMMTVTLELIFIYVKLGFNHVLADKGLVELGWNHSNLVAVIFVFLLPVAVYKYFSKNTFNFKYLILDIMNFVGLILTQSRGAYIGVFVILILFILIYSYRYIKNILLSLIFLVGALLFVPDVYTKITTLVFSVFDTGFLSDNGRFLLYKVAIENFLKHPILGTGLKSSYYLIIESGGSSMHYHNFLLQILSTLGIVGFILFVIVALRWIKILYKPNDVFITCVLISILGSLAHQLLDISFDYYYFGVYFYLLIGIVELYRNFQKEIILKKVN